MKTKVVIFLLIVLSFQTSLARIDAPDFRDLTLENGLPSNNVTCIAQDSQGFMWFGTGNGLVRYDGYHCKIYQNYSEEPGGISYFSICSLLNDSKGTLWIGTFARGLNRYDPVTDTFIWYKLDPEDSTSICSNHFLNALYEDRQGQFWIGTVHGLNRYDAEHDCFIRYTNTLVDSSAIRPEAINCIFEDSNKNFWLGTEGGGLVLYNRNDRKAVRFKHDPKNHHSISNDFIYSIFEDNSGVLWVGSESGFDCLRYSGDVPIFTHEGKGMPSHICSKTVYDLYAKKDCGELIHQVPQADFIDNRGNIWIATLYGGVKYYNASKNVFHTYRYEYGDLQGLKNASVLAFYENEDGSIWIGVDHGGLHLFDRKTLCFTHYLLDPAEPDDPFNETVLCLEKDSDGDLWIGTYGKGVYRMNNKSVQFTHYMTEQNNPASLNFPIVYSIFEDNRKNIWLGTYGKGMSLYDRKNEGFLPVFPYIYKNWVRKFYEDSQNNLWICTSPGLYLYDRDNKTFREWQPDPNEKNSLSNNWVTLVFEDSRGDKWIGTGYGLNHFNPEGSTFSLYTTEDGLPSTSIQGMLEDDRGYLWLSTGRGLSKFDPVNSTFKNYDVYDGLQGNQFNINACMKSKTGELFFGGTNGFTYFCPDSIQDVENIPAIVVTDFQLFNKSVGPRDEHSPLQKEISLTDEIQLAHDQHSFSFEFAVLDYINPKTNQYKYMLEGFQEDWVETGADRRVATYTNLDQGEYVFRVIGANNKGVWTKEGVSVKIIITPPWWQTTLAYFLYVLIISCIVWLTWKGQMRRVHLRQELRMKQFQADQLRELDQMKSRFFTNMSHEIRTPLTLILGPLEQLISEASKEKWKTQLQIMFRNGRQLLRLINQFLDFSKLEAGRMKLQAREVNIIPLLKGMVHSFDSLAKQKLVTLSFHTAHEEIPVYIDPDKLEKIITNLLSNAFKFTDQGGKISVDITISSGDQPLASAITGLLKIGVHDTGIGISANRLDHIFDRYYTGKKEGQTGTGIGLALTKELVELHHGTISVETEPGKGSTFIIVLPLGKAHLKKDEIVTDHEEEITPTEIPLEDFMKPPGQPVKKVKEQAKKELPFILIVEDTEDVRTYIRGFLEPDYQIDEAQDGKDGFERAAETIPDLIVSDVMMPKMDGFQLCEKLKTDERTSHIPVILLTARASEGSKLEGLETGADDYLVKPFNARELKIRIKNLIEQRRKLRERFTRDGTFSPKDISVTSADERFLERAIEIIENNMGDSDFGVDVFGKDVGLSHSQLHRKIRALTNQSPVEFVRTFRLKRAASLLKQKYGNVAEIAYEVGFNNPAYFAECFRKQFGHSPSEYLKLNS